MIPKHWLLQAQYYMRQLSESAPEIVVDEVGSDTGTEVHQWIETMQDHWKTMKDQD